MIPLFVHNGVAYVWNSDDWHRLRTEYRICGSMIGCIATYPRQNDFLGLPMALTSEETAFLVERSICELIDLPNLTEKPSKEIQLHVKKLEERLTQEQTEALHKRKIQELTQKIDIIIAGKRQKLLSQGVTDAQLDRETLLQEEINKLPKLSPAYLLVHLPTEHFLPTEKRKVNIDVLKPTILDTESSKRYAVFKDLWEKGYYITSGLKFGCHYLVYSGDPVKFHATWMVRCVSYTNTKFCPSEIVTFGRLSVAVNKLAVFASVNESGSVNYQTLKWHDSPING
ncbi:hypothetical protein ACJJTC_014913 [Scirpophaga incertulas]